MNIKNARSGVDSCGGVIVKNKNFRNFKGVTVKIERWSEEYGYPWVHPYRMGKSRSNILDPF